jgi:hypothetical protein
LDSSAPATKILFCFSFILKIISCFFFAIYALLQDLLFGSSNFCCASSIT